MSPSEEYAFSGKGKEFAESIYTESPREGEGHHLHTALLHKTGANNFADMRNLIGVVCGAC